MFQQDKDFMQIVNVLIMQMNPEVAQRAQQEAMAEKQREEAAKEAAVSAVNKGYGSWAPPKKTEEPKEEPVWGCLERSTAVREWMKLVFDSVIMPCCDDNDFGNAVIAKCIDGAL